MNLLSKPYHALALAALLLILLSLVQGVQRLDMPLPDAAYVLSYADTLRAMALLLLLFWILYMVTIRILFSSMLVWIHISITLILPAIIVFLFFRFAAQPVPEAAVEMQLKRNNPVQIIIPALILALLLTQLSYIVNLILGLMRRMS
ncbi:MAG TPA: hypothetical protein VFV68_02155 [Agriterribacter sp.]|nr:hypothetical protein [Agriterribacter sp.]